MYTVVEFITDIRWCEPFTPTYLSPSVFVYKNLTFYRDKVSFISNSLGSTLSTSGVNCIATDNVRGYAYDKIEYEKYVY